MTPSMRPVVVADAAPPDSFRVVGVLGGRPLGGVGAEVDRFAATVEFGGDLGTTLVVPGRRGAGTVLVGLGDSVDVDALTMAAGAAAQAVPAPVPLATDLHLLAMEGACQAVVTGLRLGSYRYHRYRSRASAQPAPVTLIGPAGPEAVAGANDLSAAVGLARDWVNTPAADQSPADLADAMVAHLAEAGCSAESWGEERIRSERLGGLEAVAAGSGRPPRLVMGEWCPPKPAAHLTLIGKGVVFDSGGLSLKQADMERMKGDMAGAAAVVAATAAIARQGRPVAVTVIAPLVENMPGGRAYRPGDVVTTRSGTTIEVVNTDAEGRLILADALTLAVERAAERSRHLLVDVATLTGAVRVALGNAIAGLWASGDEPAERLLAAGAGAGERLWHMPLPADYRKMIDSDVADMKNIGGRFGGAITAALLLSEFAADHDWAHLDIAGPAWAHEAGPLGPKGGTGFGVRTLIRLAADLGDPSLASRP